MYQSDPAGPKKPDMLDKMQPTMFERKVNPIQFEHEVRFFVLPFANIATLLDGDTTPDVSNTERLFSPSTPVTVTDFTKGAEGQIITILGNGNLTVTHGTRIKTNTGANKVLAADTLYSFVNFSDVWYETGVAPTTVPYQVQDSSDVTDIDVSGAGSVLSVSVPSIVAGDTIELDLHGSLLVSAGGAYNIATNFSLGSFAINLTAVHSASSDATQRVPVRLKVIYHIKATNDVHAFFRLVWYNRAAASADLAVGVDKAQWRTSALNLTGTRLVTTEVFTSGGGGITFRLYSYRIRKY